MSTDAQSASRLFISHSSQDDAFVRALCIGLADHGQDGWIDSRELRGGDPLWPEIQAAIEAASAVAVVVSPDALQSKWVGKELRYALDLRAQRGRDKFRVIPLSLDGTKLGVLEEFFGEEPKYIPVESGAGGVEAAMDAILVALGKRLPADEHVMPQPRAEPLEELVLELDDLKFYEQDGTRRASARARLVYQPADAGQEPVHSERPWRLVAPIGPIEAEELRWYLEKYAVWPSHYFGDRARKVEENLAEWGRLLHKAAMPAAYTANVSQAWARISEHAGRRFSVSVDPALEAGASDTDVATAKEVARLLLGLPWELLHDADDYLFQGATPTRVRRRLPNTRSRNVLVVRPPIRILLVTARPEDESCSYIDHRASALPLVEAMEALPGLVQIHVLDPPTLPALREELGRARRARQPYHVVHFDGHGVYDRTVGLGGLCFEHPGDTTKLVERRHITVYTQDQRESTGLGSLLRQHRILLVFLEACQGAHAEKASESVASELLKVGVASVVAMSHSVLVETSSRFVEAFYEALADGKRVGDAMLAGQRQLKDNPFRGRIFGACELRLEDWFVPVLFQERDDPQLFTVAPARQTKEDFQAALTRRLGDLPAVPETGFIGRSRELLALQRLLRTDAGARYAVVRGQGGEGKTTLAAEFARWMVRSHQVHRAAFVSVEGLEKNITESVVDKLGHQFVKSGFSTQADCNGDLERATQEIERALREQPTLLVMDNMESILLPLFVREETPEALSEEIREELDALLALCERLLKVGYTRLVFTSREALPAPFAGERQRLELHRLGRDDAVKLVERVLNAEGGDAGVSDAAREEIEQLVDAVHCHARTLALLAPSLRTRGVQATRETLVHLMAEMERKFPGSREKSVFASVELSLHRLSTANRERVRALGVFHGSVYLDVLRAMMQWDEGDVAVLAVELVEAGLATPNGYDHLTLNPALCPYLRAALKPAEYQVLIVEWIGTMHSYTRFLVRHHRQNPQVAATLTALELPNLFALLNLVELAGDAEVTIDLATSLYELLEHAGKPRLLERVWQVRDAASLALDNAWSHASFEAARTRIEQQLSSGRVREAVDGAGQLLQHARAVGEKAYFGAGYDLAMAFNLVGQALHGVGAPEQALLLFEEAAQRFEVVTKEHPGVGAERMVSVCIGRRADCLLSLGRLEEAAAAYEEKIHLAEQLDDARQVAVGKGQLGTVRMRQGRYREALDAHAAARERFTQLSEPGMVAVSWHQTGNALQLAGEPESAEDAYRKALSIWVRLGDLGGQATTLGELGNLYDVILDRPEQAAGFYRQSLDNYIQMGDAAGEGVSRNNLASTLRRLGRYDEARQEIHRAFECSAGLGNSAEPWKSWSILADLESEAGNSTGAAEANRKAIFCYLTYRRDGGENHTGPGRLVHDVTQSLLVGDRVDATAFLQQLANEPDATWLLPFIRALQAIVRGSRDRALADAPELDYMMAAEILCLIETLENAESVGLAIA